MPKKPEEMWTSITRNYPEKTGKSLEEWIEVLKAEGLEGHKNQVTWLKKVHGLGHFQATLVVNEAMKPADWKPPTDDELLNAQYSGSKATLRPIYDQLVSIVTKLPEASLEMRKTYVTLTRRRHFGLIKVSTKTRIDLGLVLPDVTPKGRLESSLRFGSGRITHKVALSKSDDVDDEVIRWIKAAYEADA